jgi:hypothetical protein
MSMIIKHYSGIGSGAIAGGAVQVITEIHDKTSKSCQKVKRLVEIRCPSEIVKTADPSKYHTSFGVGDSVIKTLLILETMHDFENKKKIMMMQTNDLDPYFVSIELVQKDRWGLMSNLKVELVQVNELDLNTISNHASEYYYGSMMNTRPEKRTMTGKIESGCGNTAWLMPSKSQIKAMKKTNILKINFFSIHDMTPCWSKCSVAPLKVGLDLFSCMNDDFYSTLNSILQSSCFKNNVICKINKKSLSTILTERHVDVISKFSYSLRKLNSQIAGPYFVLRLLNVLGSRPKKNDKILEN